MKDRINQVEKYLEQKDISKNNRLNAEGMLRNEKNILSQYEDAKQKLLGIKFD